MTDKIHALIPAAILIFATAVPMRCLTGQGMGSGGDDPDARPHVTNADLRIAQRARDIINSPE